METLELCFHGPYSLRKDEKESILLNAVGREKGIYLWTIRLGDRYLTYYVGETGVSFAARTTEHIKNYFQGQYSLYEPRDFARGKKVLLWGGMWKEKRNNPSTIQEFLDRYTTLAPKCSDLLMLLCFFVAPVKSSQRLRQRMEAAIAHSLYNQSGIVGTFQDAGIRYLPRHLDEPPICLKLQLPKQIMGLRTRLVI